MPSDEGSRSVRVVVGCLVAFTVAMLALRYVLHQAVPPASAWADETVGVGPFTVLLLAGWGVAAFFGYRPLVKRWLAERRERAIRSRQ